MSTHHPVYHSKDVLIQEDHDKLVPFDIGLTHPKHLTWIAISLFVLWAGALGILIWLAIELHKEKKYACSDAPQKDMENGYVRFEGRALEPYMGTPSNVQENVGGPDVCYTTCNSDTSCLGFSHDKTNHRCYFYTEGVLLDQNQHALVPGPSDLDVDVYGKKEVRYVELKGALKE